MFRTIGKKLDLVTLALLSVVLVPVAALAIDGTILMDQNRATVGNITPGDQPGYPISLTRPGSYRLSGNLTPPDNTTAIEIAADDVALDLNGFAIIGSSPNPFGNNTAILEVGSRNRTTIRNGSITSFNTGIDLRSSTHMIIENMHLNVRTGNFIGTSLIAGFNLPSSAIIKGNVSVGLLSIACPALVIENVASTYGFTIGVSGQACVTSNNVTAP